MCPVTEKITGPTMAPSLKTVRVELLVFLDLFGMGFKPQDVSKMELVLVLMLVGIALGARLWIKKRFLKY